MILLYIILTIIVLLAAVYLFLIGGRKVTHGFEKLEGTFYAHRGLHNKPTIPENSLAALRLAADKGYGAEFDVHLMADGNLAVIHDSSLLRTAGADVKIEELTTADLENYTLEASDERIPLFTEVLEIFDGKAPVIIELKTAGSNASRLCEAVFKVLDNYKGDFCVESFDPRCLIWLKKNRPQVIRGQLSQNYFKPGKSSGMGGAVDFILTHLLGNFLTRPDFIAYEFCDRKKLSNTLCRRLWGLHSASWTIKTKEDFDVAVKEGYLPIFEQFEP